MKKLIVIISVIACAFSVSAQDSLYINQKDGSIISYAISNIDSITFTKKSGSSESNTSTTDVGVLINGVRWATRNVNTPGTFTNNNYDAGYFYQWNSNVGWPSTGAIGSITATDGTTTWNSSWAGGYTTPSATDTWTSTNDPSPQGWRVPTLTEIRTLVDATKVTAIWTTQNGVYGERFTDKTTGNTLFLSASGYRYHGDGALSLTGSNGFYWSSSALTEDLAHFLGISKTSAFNELFTRVAGFTVRPVAE